MYKASIAGNEDLGIICNAFPTIKTPWTRVLDRFNEILEFYPDGLEYGNAQGTLGELTTMEVVDIIANDGYPCHITPYDKCVKGMNGYELHRDVCGNYYIYDNSILEVNPFEIGKARSKFDIDYLFRAGQGKDQIPIVAESRTGKPTISRAKFCNRTRILTDIFGRFGFIFVVDASPAEIDRKDTLKDYKESGACVTRFNRSYREESQIILEDYREHGLIYFSKNDPRKAAATATS